jgi:hypothetical protein
MKPRLVPALDWLARYEGAWLRADVMAGLTTAAVVIPKAMAYATIAGLPVQIGLYAALVPMAVYAALGSSRVLSVSTTTTLGILSAAALADAAPNAAPAALVAASATLAVLTGLVLLAARLLRLGFVANFISEPVLTGFKAGIGLVIVLDQAPKLLGVHYDKAGWIRDALSLVGHPPAAHAAIARRRARDARGRGRPRAPRPAAARAAPGGGRRHRRVALPRPRGFGRSRRRSHPGRPARARASELALVERFRLAAVAIALMSFTERSRPAAPSRPPASRGPTPTRSSSRPARPTCWAGSSARCPAAAARPRRRSTARPGRARRPRRSSPRA